MAYDIKRMYKHARGFQLAAERCLETRAHPEQRNLPIQAIVNYAFACEVYLKAIYAFENPDADNLRGHYLDELFAQISEEYQKLIQDKLKSHYTETDIMRYMKEFRKIFEEYRYIYEISSENRTHFGFLCYFVSVLQDIVGNLTAKSVLRMAGLEEML